ncbi:MAG: SDR family NAD(P)-dependent oxidoreductase [Lachnospiraceae bacterium]
MKKTILITGASQGIGAGTATYLLEQGHNVILVARQEEKLKKICAEFPNQAQYYIYDFENVEHVKNIFDFCNENNIKLDGMVHAAGITEDCPARSVDSCMMEKMLRINYMSFVQLCRYYCMKKYSNDGGSIVALSSMASFSCDKGMSQYAASKSAINTYIKVLSKELVKRRIRVNAIAPGFVNTSMMHNTKDVIEEFDQMVERNQPFGVIPIEQIVYAVDFLLSNRSEYITGIVLPISGGSLGV